MASRLCNNSLLRIFLVLVCITVTAGSARPTADSQAETCPLAQHSQNLNGEAEILQSWQGDYPVARLDLLPENQRERAVGFIGDPETFEGVWKAFKPGEAIPEIDFQANLVLFARNTQFYNSIRIGKVNVINGVAEVLAMETMSAMPIEDKVAMSMVVVPRKGITSIRTPAGSVVISGQTVFETYVYEPQKRAHSPQLAAGLASESENGKVPYGRCGALPQGRTFPAACCGELQCGGGYSFTAR